VVNRARWNCRWHDAQRKLDVMTSTIADLIPDYIRGLPVYVPGRPIEEVERELGIHAIKLASNENPLGPSPKALEAMKVALAESHRYPDGGTHQLREKLARKHGVAPEQILIGLGSSEIIDLAARVLLGPGKTGITSEGSYAPFSVAIRASGAELRRVPMRDFSFDLKAMAKAVTPATRVAYLANPNNPTGTAFGAGELEEFLGNIPEDVLVVLDEAYIHYAERADMPQSVEIFRKRENLLVMRTFSKVYGLAGLRIGYGIAQAGVVAAMDRLRTPFNVTGVSQAAAIAALDDVEHVQRSIASNASERKCLLAEFAKLGLRAVPSHANFIFIDIGSEAPTLTGELLQEGVIVRPLAWMGWPEAIRVSVGTAEENDRLLAGMSRCRQSVLGKTS
jgi:histidinol-phosphate aminotransferase